MAKAANIATRQKADEVSLDDKVATLNQLVIAANDNKKNVGKLRAFLKENPDLPGKVTSIAVTIRADLIEKFIGGEGSKLLVKKYLEAMEDRLRGDEPTEIERLLIEAVLCCWLRLQAAENYRNSFSEGKHRFIDMEFADKMLSKAQSRYLRALTALAKVQDLNAQKRKKIIKLEQIGGEWQ
jgi:hypothetical protein